MNIKVHWYFFSPISIALYWRPWVTMSYCICLCTRMLTDQLSYSVVNKMNLCTRYLRCWNITLGSRRIQNRLRRGAGRIRENHRYQDHPVPRPHVTSRVYVVKETSWLDRICLLLRTVVWFKRNIWLWVEVQRATKGQWR